MSGLGVLISPIPVHVPTYESGSHYAVNWDFEGIRGRPRHPWLDSANAIRPEDALSRRPIRDEVALAALYREVPEEFSVGPPVGPLRRRLPRPFPGGVLRKATYVSPFSEDGPRFIEQRDCDRIERRSYTVLGGSETLDVVMFDVGPAISFAPFPSERVDPLEREYLGQRVGGAFLSLDLEDPAAIVAFFERFGMPPDIRYEDEPGMSMWGPGTPRWISLRDLRTSQLRVREQVEAGKMPTQSWALGFMMPVHPKHDRPASFGTVRMDDAGSLYLGLTLWQAIALDLARDLTEDRIGYCAEVDCGRPFVAARIGRRRFCSDACRSRASSRTYYARRH